MISFITYFVNLTYLFIDHQTFLLHISYHVYLYRIIYTWIFNFIFHIWRLLFEFALIKDTLQIEDRKWFWCKKKFYILSISRVVKWKRWIQEGLSKLFLWNSLIHSLQNFSWHALWTTSRDQHLMSH